MTGLGTKESPFKIQTVEDFLSMGETGSPTAYYELASDINMDGDGNRRLQDNPKITLNCASLDGKGHKIRNLILMRPNSKAQIFVSADEVKSVTITNLNFENMNLSGQTMSLFAGNGCTYRLYKCSFTMFVKTHATSNDLAIGGLVNYSSTTEIMCDSCTFIIRADCSSIITSAVSGATGDHSYVRNCQFKFYGTLQTNATSSTALGSFFRNTEVTNVFLEGHIRVLNRTPEKDSYFPLTDGNCKISNMFFVFGGTEVNKISVNGTFLSPCVYDLDVAKDAEYVSSSSTQKLYGLTDADCRNAEKLREVGFDFEEA